MGLGYEESSLYLRVSMEDVLMNTKEINRGGTSIESSEIELLQFYISADVT